MERNKKDKTEVKLGQENNQILRADFTLGFTESRNRRAHDGT